jgi:hypothetical protein
VADHQVGAGGQPVPQVGDDPDGLVLVDDEMQNGDQQDRDLPVQVEVGAYLLTGLDSIRGAGVAGDGDGLVVAGEWCARMDQDQVVVVDVHRACGQVDRLGDLVHVARAGQPCSDVGKLVHPGFGQPGHRTTEEGPVPPPRRSGPHALW